MATLYPDFALLDWHRLRKLIGSVQDVCTWAINTHQEVPTVGNIQPVQHIAASVLGPEISGERAGSVEFLSEG